MKKLSFLILIFSVLFISCNNNDEPEIVLNNNRIFDRFMSQQKIVKHVPTELTTGEDAPFYLIDAERQIYMKVIDNRGEMLIDRESLYIRLSSYIMRNSGNGVSLELSSTNEVDPIATPADFIRYVQDSDAPTLLPLHYVGDWSEVCLAIRQITDKADNPVYLHIQYYPDTN